MEEVRSQLPLPEEPPVAPDWNTADARPVAVGSGRLESDISTGPASEAGLRQPASTKNVDLSRIGRQGKDDLKGPPKDAISPTLAIGLMLARKGSEFGQPQAGEKFPPPLDIFENGVVQILSDVGAYIDPQKLLRPEGIVQEREFVHRIVDIREDPVMLQEILDQQQGIPWNTDRIDNLIQNQLNMKRTYASIRDARTGLIFSAMAIVFAVITFIFAPLTFMTNYSPCPLKAS
ncbi:uncharacterized protein F4812DRAFT_461157 [Daldinia caldariorum]|uniref:uncharacterized protein n=1 Tax=Daldinia caldariorum TaxID=326644 RepID=UPI0020079CB9|nr:uncharacterized protein F4812DRAFT_461157 [Daldinia caldariorum]KAI1466186.1 hypothetical protein F4812DRAFT_461157 [Daldinia caldariorum]